LIGDGFGRRRYRCLEEGGSPDAWARDVSETQRGKGARRSHAIWAGGGSAQGGARMKQGRPRVLELGRDNGKGAGLPSATRWAARG
jgi:hypothetical protein